ncbi:hypothetical protein [Thermolongibacillus altinsuensis]|nr:hypothetical protein [Thermolongibacillus altinsuensis]
MTDKFICLMAFSFGEVAEKIVYVEKSNLSYIEGEEKSFGTFQ